MTTEEDKMPEKTGGGAPEALDPPGEGASIEAGSEEGSSDAPLAKRNGDTLAESLDEALAKDGGGTSEEDEYEDVPVQLGSQRFVFAAYFAGGIAVAFLLSKGVSYAWARVAI